MPNELSLIEEMRIERATSRTVAFQEFALSTSSYADYLFCFFEGKDNAYYVPRIKEFTDKYYPIKCGNREKLLHLHQLIANRSEYTIYKKAFFIDRDFNEPLPPQRLPIFETPCYSIENFYVSPAVFEEILINKFYFSRTENIAKPFHICLEIYKERQSEFHEAVLLFNAWYACLIDNKKRTKQTANASLNEKLPKNFVSFSLQEVSSNYDLEKIKNTFKDAPIVEEVVLQTKIDEFKDCVQHEVFRGKYELQFLIVMLRLFLKNANTKGQRTILKEKIKFAFGDAGGLNQEQAINIFNDCAETPQSLKDYLEQVTTE